MTPDPLKSSTFCCLFAQELGCDAYACNKEQRSKCKNLVISDKSAYHVLPNVDHPHNDVLHRKAFSIMALSLLSLSFLVTQAALDQPHPKLCISKRIPPLDHCNEL